MKNSNNIRGDVRIAQGCVIDSSAQIHARRGPIEISSGNVIEAGVKIENNKSNLMQIGSGNIFREGSSSESLRVGSGNVLKARAYVGSNVELTSGCIIGANRVVSGNRKFPVGTSIADY